MMIRRYAVLAALAICMWAAPTIARADATCDSTFAQNMARQGYQYLDAGRYQDARVAAGQLALYAKGCDDPKVGYPSVVYSAYIGSAAFHGMGDDARAEQALQAGMMVLGVLKKDGGYSNLVAAMEPKFAALQHELKLPPVQNAPAAQGPQAPPGSIVH